MRREKFYFFIDNTKFTEARLSRLCKDVKRLDFCKRYFVSCMDGFRINIQEGSRK